MKLDKYSNPIYSTQELFNELYCGEVDIFTMPVERSESTMQLEQLSDKPLNYYAEPNITIEDFDYANQSNWYIPDNYLEFDPLEYCLNKCTNDAEIERVCLEYVEFESRQLIRVLQWAKYFVDTCTTHNVLWGVGRGSSVSCFLLYLIGINKINPLTYNLHYNEFLK